MTSERDYPTEDELKRIEEWDYNDPAGWFDFVIGIWWAADWGIRRVRNRIYMSTGGWSGNEDIIESMQKNFILWSQLWYSVRACGHYIFIVKKSIVSPSKK